MIVFKFDRMSGEIKRAIRFCLHLIAPEKRVQKKVHGIIKTWAGLELGGDSQHLNVSHRHIDTLIEMLSILLFF